MVEHWADKFLADCGVAAVENTKLAAKWAEKQNKHNLMPDIAAFTGFRLVLCAAAWEANALGINWVRDYAFSRLVPAKGHITGPIE